MTFYKSIAPFYEKIFPLNQKQIEFIESSMDRKSSSNRILDVGCGVGSLVKVLDKKFNNVYGVDLDEEMITFAQKESYLNNPVIQAGNMLKLSDLFEDKKFDTIICFGNTLVHLPGNNEIKEFIRQAYNMLVPGGKLLLQIINYNRILDQKVDYLPTIDNSHINFIRDYDYLPKTNQINFKTNLTIKETNQIIKNEQLLNPIRPNDLVELIKNAGFNTVSVFGAFNRSLFTKDSVPFIIEATKF